MFAGPGRGLLEVHNGQLVPLCHGENLWREAQRRGQAGKVAIHPAPPAMPDIRCLPRRIAARHGIGQGASPGLLPQGLHPERRACYNCGGLLKEMGMSISVRIDDALVEQARAAAKAEFRTVQGQIEFWAKVGRAALDNPDLPASFIAESLMAMAEPSEEATPFSPRHRK